MGNRQDLDATPTRALNIVRFGLLGLAVVIVGGMRLVLHGAARWRGDPAPATNQIKLLVDQAKDNTRCTPPGRTCWWSWLGHER